MTQYDKALGFPFLRRTLAQADLVRAVRKLALPLQNAAEHNLRDRTEELREAIEQTANPTADDVLVPGFALVNEAARRTLGITFFDVQLLAGLILARGEIAEMQTGEGKTFVAALPAFLHALAGRGVHVMTSNRYLAERDYESLAPVYRLLGLSVGLISEETELPQKRAAYACDITYGPGYEFGFDYLRDQAALQQTRSLPLGHSFRALLRGRDELTHKPIQRGLAFAVVDEIDSVLIDDACSPLVLSQSLGNSEKAQPIEQAFQLANDDWRLHSGPQSSIATRQSSNNATAFLAAQDLIGRLAPDADYIVDAATGTIQLTTHGSRKIHEDSVEIARHALVRPWSEYVENALRANLLLKHGVDYIVQDGGIRLVDQFTGRISSQRSWSDGLHQAVEVKEGLAVTDEKRPLARITRQRFFRRYEGLCGMTGTAVGSEREFWEFYRLRVTPIPLRKPSRRTILPSRFFATREAKWEAIVEELEGCRQSGQPVLVGTRTIAASEALAERLDAKGLAYRLLNGKQDADEAAIIAGAGEPGAITIATNMAGRGTDIRLAPGVAERGGLYVIGTERHESGRIDRQLIGRAARQGDPGSARFFLSADDALLRLFAPRLAQQIIKAAQSSRHAPRAVRGEATSDFTRQLDQIQRRVERLRYARRRQLFHQDRVRETVLAKFAQED